MCSNGEVFHVTMLHFKTFGLSLFGFKHLFTPDDVLRVLSPSCLRVCVDVDGASDPDAEPDERETDGDADGLVQRVSQILRLFLYSGHVGTHSGVRSGEALVTNTQYTGDHRSWRL